MDENRATQARKVRIKNNENSSVSRPEVDIYRLRTVRVLLTGSRGGEYKEYVILRFINGKNRRTRRYRLRIFISDGAISLPERTIKSVGGYNHEFLLGAST